MKREREEDNEKDGYNNNNNNKSPTSSLVLGKAKACRERGQANKVRSKYVRVVWFI